MHNTIIIRILGNGYIRVIISPWGMVCGFMSMWGKLKHFSHVGSGPPHTVMYVASFFGLANLKCTYSFNLIFSIIMVTSKQTDKHNHVFCNAVPLVWGPTQACPNKRAKISENILSNNIYVGVLCRN